MSAPTLALIVPAAGSGVRLGKSTPKPYLKIAGKAILEHTLERFVDLDGLSEVYISTSSEYLDDTTEILDRLFPLIKRGAVLGGKERQHSIMNALNKVSSDTELVAIHDAVRPFIERELIQKCVAKAEETGAAIIAIKAKDTIKISDSELSIEETPDRNNLWQAQTPQIFEQGIIREAYETARRKNFLGTDDSSLVEHLGRKVVLVEGTRQNFKITFPIDLKLAEWLIEK